MTTKSMAKLALSIGILLALTACGGGGWEEECADKGGELIKTEGGDLVCFTSNRLPALPGPGQGG